MSKDTTLNDFLKKQTNKKHYKQNMRLEHFELFGSF